MNQYYLMSQLPALDGLGDSAPLPISEQSFLELCERLLPQKTFAAISGINLIPPKEAISTGYGFIDKWNDFERDLRMALGGIRAEKSGKRFENESGFISSEFLSAARIAAENENPLEAEAYLDGIRARFLENIRPADPFCEDAVFHYAIRLKIMARLRLFDSEKGAEAYRNIYNSIMSQDRQEA